MTAFLRTTVASLALLVLLSTAPESTLAYGGPGSVISGIGALLAAIAALLASLFGFVWFPLKRLFRKIRGDERDPAAADESTE